MSNISSKKVKKYWVDSARYDWYKARKEGNIFEKVFYNSKIRYILSLTAFENKRILDMGCGTGVNTYDFYKKSKKTIGIDISPWAIERAKNNFKEISFYIRDSEKTRFPHNYFDIIVNTGLIQYLRNPKLTVDEIHRILKPGGTAVIEVPWKYGIYNSKRIRSHITGRSNPNDEPVNKTYDSKMFKRLFEKFECIKIRSFFFVVLYGVFKKV
ncbi:class I SAM-dependent methyltransferase [Candidatus Woesearchaeota archaeon]|nr:class I SAM-dependent methyltransferase [Candidatus Woesearchaeota archaeon]